MSTSKKTAPEYPPEAVSSFERLQREMRVLLNPLGKEKSESLIEQCKKLLFGSLRTKDQQEADEKRAAEKAAEKA